MHATDSDYVINVVNPATCYVLARRVIMSDTCKSRRLNESVSKWKQQDESAPVAADTLEYSQETLIQHHWWSTSFLQSPEGQAASDCLEGN
jgi:hypothetical protein